MVSRVPLVGNLGDVLGMDLIRKLPENLPTDQALLYYAVHTWNDYL